MSYSRKILGRLLGERNLLHRLRRDAPSKLQRVLGSASTLVTDNPCIGLCGFHDRMPLTAAQMILGYSQGLFPMDGGGKLRWQCPDPRFVLNLGELRISANMRRDIRKRHFTHTFDRAPRLVLEGCAEGRPDHWFSERLKAVYLELFDLGAMHTIETWSDGALVGGSFGIAIGQVFTGETMFHRVPEAGKSCIAHLASHLRECGFVCIDAQWPSAHMTRFGAREMALSDYRQILALGLVRPAQLGEPRLKEAGTDSRVERTASPGSQVSVRSEREAL